MSLKQRTISGLKWSLIDSLTGQGINFVTGIVLARMLSPKEFGFIGVIVVFIAIAQSLVNSGFSQALIRKQNCGQKDYSTVFFFNLGIGVSCYLALFFLAGPISSIFKEPQLFVVIRILGIVLIIDGMGLIQRTIFMKKLNFRLQAEVSGISSIVSGTVAISLAYNGWGVWSLVWKSMIQSVLTVILLWLRSRWRPSFSFNMLSFRELFGFGSKLLMADLIDTVYRNIYYLVIGKYFSAAELGYYMRADEFKNIPSANLHNIIGRVSYPVLSSMQGDSKKLKAGYKKLTMSTMFISFVLMLGLASVAEPLVLILVGERWLTSVPYLQLLCFVGMLYPLHALNLNVLSVKARSDLVLRLEFVKKPLFIPVIVIGVLYGIKSMIIGMILSSLVALLLNSYWSGKMINYPLREQVIDITPSFAIACIMGMVVSLIGKWLPFAPILTLGIQLSIGLTIVAGAARIVRLAAYKEIENILILNFLALLRYGGSR